MKQAYRTGKVGRPRKIFQYEADQKWGASYETVQRWLRELSPVTIENYLRFFKLFCEDTGKDPDQFLAWSKTEDPVIVWDHILKNGDGLTESLRFDQRVAVRSFLSHNGLRNLPKMKQYIPQSFHRPYRKEEARKLVGYLDSPVQKLFAYLLAETGLRAGTVLAIRYRHIKEDFEAGVTPCAVRLEPKFYVGRKAAGFTFLGQGSVSLLKECIKNRLVKTRENSPLVPLSYSNLYQSIALAKTKAGLDSKLQALHGFRKLFENSLDKAGIDPEQKMILEGHYATARAKSYTDREFDNLRPLYAKAYGYVNLEGLPEEVEKRYEDQQEEIDWLKDRLSWTMQIFLELGSKEGLSPDSGNAATQILREIGDSIKRQPEYEHLRALRKGKP